MNKNLAVFCGSSAGFNPIYAEAAKLVGHTLAQEGIGIVYGGGNVGLMGILADAALAAGGHVIGVIPGFLKEKEVCHLGLSELHVVESMHERKVKMARLSQGVIALPGGYGTLDEVFEMVTLAQLGQDMQPAGLFNVNGFFNHLITYIDHAHQEGFIKQAHRELLHHADDFPTLLAHLLAYKPVELEGKWWVS